MSWRPEEENDGHTSLHALILEAISFGSENNGQEVRRLLEYITMPIEILGIGDVILRLAKELE